ncbi:MULTISPECIES: hypothetical protein [Okeania]|uniref:hypothetical protein n=2 Tax=Microcoleaceae TaxID=1892252 RepID=UPI0013753653|nr:MULTISPECIES: hypothetical protein [Okeania]NET15004.1 hypothetical protein [Okeania sp. SIO1H6]NES76149.1 hypothetical protein [Okeania sp. SIO1H4]NET19592.1 hypothetical protein [Okeania sp. SIO1H5]NET75709.1 hypothetical protein [Okeania sp. SIO1F9]NET93329.1 hypothetical protein [Okeania sp. SIO1H2]
MLDLYFDFVLRAIANQNSSPQPKEAIAQNYSGFYQNGTQTKNCNFCRDPLWKVSTMV